MTPSPFPKEKRHIISGKKKKRTLPPPEHFSAPPPQKKKTFQAGAWGQYKTLIKNQGNHIYSQNLSSVAPISFDKEKFLTGAGRISKTCNEELPAISGLCLYACAS